MVGSESFLNGEISTEFCILAVITVFCGILATVHKMEKMLMGIQNILFRNNDMSLGFPIMVTRCRKNILMGPCAGHRDEHGRVEQGLDVFQLGQV